jgi:mediator of RNA polymerase II transcription subunit 12
MQREVFCADSLDQLTGLCCKAYQDLSFPSKSEWSVNLTLHILASSAGQMIELVDQDASGHFIGKVVGQTCEDILAATLSDRDLDAALDPCQVIHSATALNVHISVCWLRAHLSKEKKPFAHGRVKNALLDAFNSHLDIWPQILDAAPQAILTDLHDYARDRILFSHARPSEQTQDVWLLSQLLYVTHTDSDVDHSQVLATITEKLKAIDSEMCRTSLQPLEVLLHVCTLYGHSRRPVDEKAHAALLSALCALLIQPFLQSVPILDYIHDVAALYLDRGFTSPEALTAVAKSCTNQSLGNNAYIASLLPQCSPSAPDLVLASRVRAPASLTTGAINQTAQQRALARHPGPSAPAKSVVRAPQSVEMRYTPYPLRTWEVMPDPTPVMGENDCSISLGLFGARKV